MDVARLTGLAKHLRELTWLSVLSHGEALDAASAIPGLRNWPEVRAFPQRVVDSTLDLPAAERLARRLQRDHAVDITPGALLYLLEMAEFHAVTPQRRGTERLIVTTSAPGAGHLKASRIADKVVDFEGSRVCGPVPSASDPVAFFEAREAAHDRDARIADWLYEWDRAIPSIGAWNALLAACRGHDRVELWIDPTPNKQLLGMQLIDGLSHEPDVLARLFVVWMDDPLRGAIARELHAMQPNIVKVGIGEIELARRAWTAYRQPTPLDWFALLGSDLDALPLLRRTVGLLLDELPALGTGIGATERLLLDTMAPGAVRPWRFFERNAQHNPSRVYNGLFEEMRIVNRLGSGPRPPIVGLRDPTFGPAEMMDSERRRRYLDCELSLSDLGCALGDGKDDYARHNAIHRWWGGTLLTNDRLWRWDAANQALAAPR